MDGVVDRLEELQAEFAAVLADACCSEAVAGLSDAELMRLLSVSGSVQRGLEGVLAEAAVQVRDRSEGMRAERLTSTHGCARPADLLQMVLRVDQAHAGRLVKAAGLTKRTEGVTDGVFQPAAYEELRLALAEGVIGLDGFLAAVGPIEAARRRLTDDMVVEADRQLALFARGVVDPDAADESSVPCPSPAELKVFADVLAAYLDPDGAEPTDDEGSRSRGLWIGKLRRGSVPVRGELLPEVAAQLSRLIDSLLNPRVDPVAEPEGVVPESGTREGVHFEESTDVADEDEGLVSLDTRTWPQKMHDAFAAILGVAARSGGVPDLGGAAPTLVVTVSAEDYVTGEGWAWVDGPDGESMRIPGRVAAQTGCAGGVQRVLYDSRGRIVGLSTSGRIFTSLQRRAIIARDGGSCLIPGCTTPATWCEIHHVREHADGGPTSTDNGVALCWHHHRTLHVSEWQVRMNHGVPETRGPLWWDREQKWRPAGRRREPARERLRERARSSPGF